MLNFIICDDTDAQIIRDAVEPVLEELNLGKIIIAENNPDRVIEYAKKDNSPSVYFLDVELNASLNGIEVARYIRERNDAAYIVFITAYEEFAFLTYKYKLHAMDYIVKPIKHEDIKNCLQSIIESEEREKTRRDENNIKSYILDIKSGWKHYRIDARDIIYLEVIKNKVIIHTEMGQISFLATMKEIKDKLCYIDAKSFKSCHKSYLVNIKKIKLVAGMDLIMANGDRCPISRNCKREIIDAFSS